MVLVHEGGFQTGSLSDINGCEGALAGSAIAVSSSDWTMRSTWWSAATHAAYNCRLPNATGRTIPVSSSSAFGRVLTDMDVTIDPVTRTAATVTNRLVVATIRR